MGNDRHLRGVMLLASGSLAGWSLPPQGWPWLLWLALIPLWAQAGSRAHSGVVGGMVWALAATLVSHRWLLWLHPLDWVGVPGWLSLPLCLTLWLLCGLVAGFLVLGWVALGRCLDVSRFSSALILSVLWGLAEVVLAQGPLFWIGLGASALPGDPALAGVGALGGAGTLATLQLLVGWSLWRAWVCQREARLGAWLLAAAVVAGAHGVGSLALPGDSAAGGTMERLLVVQPAIPTRRKFESTQQRRLLNRLAEAQSIAASETSSVQTDALRPRSAVVLPEGALALGQLLPDPAAVEVLSGGFRLEAEEQRSSLLRFARGARVPLNWVDKHRLVPLGEWVPALPGRGWSGLSAVGGLSPGAEPRLLKRPAGDIGVAICYEISDGSALADAVRRGARWLLVTANLDPYPQLLQDQFLALARLRAIETGRWLLSAANTGPSLAVNPAGQVVSRLPLADAVSGWMHVHQRQQLTPYTRWGETPLLALLISVCFVRLLQGSRHRSRGGETLSGKATQATR